MASLAPRILLPSIVDPWRHRGGAGAATRGLLALLGRPPLSAVVDVVVPTSPLPHRLRQLLALTRAAGSASPSKALFLETRRFRREVAQRLASERYDLALINGGDLLGMRAALPPRMPAVLYAHNLERDLFAAQVGRLPAPLRRRRGRLAQDLEKLARWERDGIRAIGRVLCISAADEMRLRDEMPGLRTLHLPPCFDYPPRPRPAPRGPQLALGVLANCRWWPNRLALRWLLHEVLPSVRRDLRVHLFGAGSAGLATADARVIAHGFVPDPTDAFARCDVMLCPTRAGAGVDVKLAEALYNRVPVLGTPFAARGLAVRAPAGLAVADGAAAWVRFLDGPSLDRLAAEEVPVGTARSFAVVTHAAAVQRFVASAIAAGRPAGAAEWRCAPSP